MKDLVNHIMRMPHKKYPILALIDYEAESTRRKSLAHKFQTKTLPKFGFN